MKRGTWLGVAVLSAAAFGLSGTFIKPLLDAGWSPGAGSITRTGIAAVVLAIPTWRALRGKWSAVREHWLAVLVFGAIGIAGTQTAYFTAVSRIPVGTALMIEYLSPIVLVVATAIWQRKFPAARVIAGALLAIGGLGLVLGLGGGAALDPVGVSAAFIAALVCAVYFQLSATVPVPPLALTGLGFVIATAVSGVLGVTGLVPVQIGDWTVSLAGTQLSAVVPLAVVVGIATVVAYSMEVTAASHIGARAASFIALTEVLFAIVAAAVVLGQLPGVMQLAGGALLVLGVVCVISLPAQHHSAVADQLVPRGDERRSGASAPSANPPTRPVHVV